MDNVPSSAILAIVAIVAVCILGAFIFTTVQSQKEAGNQAVNKTEEMNTALDESTYTQYDGATVTGSQVLAAIKLMKNDGICVQVYNGGQMTQYLRKLDGAATTAVTSTDTELTAVAAGKNAKDGNNGDQDYAKSIAAAKDKSDSKHYITPSAQYVGGIVRSKANGSIIGVTFTKQ